MMMLTYTRRRMEGWTIPSGVLFHWSHLGPEFRVLCFLMSVPNRVWGSMGPPCLIYLASYILVVAQADLHLHRVRVGWYPSCLQNKPGQWGIVPCWST